ncbi:MAG: hypothetical protein JOS17DRAFT_275991 [Linnemannia elongata]|nr:MAG: hypothetical protein JOS17DRAFT_275991 [Linnemannia elongata]
MRLILLKPLLHSLAISRMILIQARRRLSQLPVCAAYNGLTTWRCRITCFWITLDLYLVLAFVPERFRSNVLLHILDKMRAQGLPIFDVSQSMIEMLCIRWGFYVNAAIPQLLLEGPRLPPDIIECTLGLALSVPSTFMDIHAQAYETPQSDDGVQSPYYRASIVGEEFEFGARDPASFTQGNLRPCWSQWLLKQFPRASPWTSNPLVSCQGSILGKLGYL